MQLIRGLHNLRPNHRGCVATIGNFDGVHLGHRQVIERLRAQARALGLPSVVILFEPQPQEYFAPSGAPARLTRLREKLIQFRALGVDRVVVLGFGRELSRMSAEAFVERLLAAGLGVRFLYVGDDFRFGRGRAGDFGLLVERGRHHGFEVANLDTFRIDGERVSSTRVRSALEAGDLAQARACLGRPFTLCGRVMHGNKRGRTIGFPTANIDLNRRVSPVRGVFAVRVAGITEHPLPGVANLGNRPTVAGDARFLLEVHLFDFSGDLYGRLVEVELVRRLRDERKFGSFEELRRQIRVDALEARDLLGLSAPAATHQPNGTPAP